MTLGIIGVVAAMTMPVLITKYQKHVTIQKLKRVNSVLSQFILRTYSDNGPVSEYLSSGTVVSEEVSEVFFDKYWRPYFKGINVAENHKTFYSSIYPYFNPNGEKDVSGILTNYSWGRVLFSTSDGILMNVHFMKWSGSDSDELGDALYSTAQKVFVDINGVKGPNRFGRDIFLMQIDFDKNVIVPYGISSSDTKINQNCSKSGDGIACFAKIVKDGWQIKDDYPW